jgi:hypothetical protein
MSRGILYVLWGDKYQRQLDRSIRFVRKFYPDIPIDVLRPDPKLGLLNKAQCIAEHNKWDETLYLDADTVVLGNLDYGFEMAKKNSMACCICECPWMRRYGQDHMDLIEYSTGVIFYSREASMTLNQWAVWSKEEPTPRSQWMCGEEVKGQANDDQYSFSRAIDALANYPFVLPLNYNFRPEFHNRFFLPIKIWHSPIEVPEIIEQHSEEVEAGKRLVTFCALSEG